MRKIVALMLCAALAASTLAFGGCGGKTKIEWKKSSSSGNVVSDVETEESVESLVKYSKANGYTVAKLQDAGFYYLVLFYEADGYYELFEIGEKNLTNKGKIDTKNTSLFIEEGTGYLCNVKVANGAYSAGYVEIRNDKATIGVSSVGECTTGRPEVPGEYVVFKSLTDTSGLDVLK